MTGRVAVLLLTLVSALALGRPAPCLSADWALSDSQLKRLAAGAIIADGEMASGWRSPFTCRAG
jgi:hypothetical protein